MTECTQNSWIQNYFHCISIDKIAIFEAIFLEIDAIFANYIIY